MRPAIAFAIAIGVSAVSAKVDRLISKRHQKRFVDDAGLYNVTFLHTNDIHAHLDEWRAGRGTDCTPGSECISGYARVKQKVDEIRNSTKDVVVLNAGDEFQGTLFFSFYGGEKVSYAVKEVGYDAFTLGNHEFDKGLDELSKFLGNITAPVVCANLKTNHTGMNAVNIKPYTILQPHNIGVIGVITPDTKGTSSGAGPGTDFSDPVEAVQKAVNELQDQGVNRIVALTHIGYEKDIELASKTRGVDLIIGGHSHTLIGNFTGAKGDYPTIQKDLDGQEVFIVTAYRWGEYLGKINLAWDSTGKVAKYEGEPIRLTNTTAQDPQLDAEVADWRKPFDEFSKQVVGQTSVELDQSTCQVQECTLGDVITDAMYDYRTTAGGKIDGALINAGGIRATIDVGEVTEGEVLTAFPFLNAVCDIAFSGQQWWNIFEGIVSKKSSVTNHDVTSFVQVSKQIKFSHNPSNPVGSRLISFEVGGSPIDLNKNYTFAAVDFLATGGDFFWNARTDFIALDTLDEVLVGYLGKIKPLSIQVEGRIIKTTETTPSTSTGNKPGAASSNVMFSSAFAGAVAVAGLVVSLV